MNKLYVIFYLINIIATQIYAAPNAANVYDVVTTNFSKTCPVLSANILVNSTTKYLSICKDVSIINTINKIGMLSMNYFYCIGMLTADLQLCNIISNNSYPYLPQNYDELISHIHEIQSIEPETLCKLMKGVEIFNDTKIVPSLEKSVIKLKNELTGPQCPKFCTDVMGEAKSNDICSMLYYIHVQINNVSKVIAHQKSVTKVAKKTETVVAPVVPKVGTFNNKITKKHSVEPIQESVKPEKPKDVPSTKETPITTTVDKTIPKANPEAISETKLETKQETKPETKPEINPESNNKIVSVDVQPSEVEPPKVPPTNLAQNITDKSTTTIPPAVVKIEPSTEKPNVNSPKNEQSPSGPGEEQTKTGDVINENPKDPKLPLDKSDEPILPEESDLTTTPESNFMIKQNSDDDFQDENEDDDEGLKESDDTNAEAQKNLDEELLNTNNKIEINPYKQSVDDEESNFFSYFMFISVMFIAGYVVYHNKQKIMALLLEGRRDRNSRRRPSTSSYRKLNSNLEEAVTSKCSGSASHVIY